MSKKNMGTDKSSVGGNLANNSFAAATVAAESKHGSGSTGASTGPVPNLICRILFKKSLVADAAVTSEVFIWRP